MIAIPDFQNFPRVEGKPSCTTTLRNRFSQCTRKIRDLVLLVGAVAAGCFSKLYRWMTCQKEHVEPAKPLQPPAQNPNVQQVAAPILGNQPAVNANAPAAPVPAAVPPPIPAPNRVRYMLNMMLCGVEEGDLTKQAVDAVVTSIKDEIHNKIHQAAPGLPVAVLMDPGTAVVTPPFGLGEVQFVAHTLGPASFVDRELAANQIKACVTNTLLALTAKNQPPANQAEVNQEEEVDHVKVRSVAFSPIGMSAGCPLEFTVEHMFTAIQEFAMTHPRAFSVVKIVVDAPHYAEAEAAAVRVKHPNAVVPVPAKRQRK